MAPSATDRGSYQTKLIMNTLDRLEAVSVFILREVYRQFTQLCMLWSMGKDIAERSGRVQDHEDRGGLEELRRDGNT